MRQWTEQEKQRQRDLIHSWQPWKRSTGAKTPEGKAKSRLNALKHGAYSTQTHSMHRVLRQAKRVLIMVQKPPAMALTALPSLMAVMLDAMCALALPHAQIVPPYMPMGT